MRKAAPSSSCSPVWKTKGLLVPASLSSRVLVAPVGAEIVSICSVRVAAGVAASIVTVLVLALVIWINEVMSGGMFPDQLVPSAQNPLSGLFQAFSAEAVKPDARTK